MSWKFIKLIIIIQHWLKLIRPAVLQSAFCFTILDISINNIKNTYVYNIEEIINVCVLMQGTLSVPLLDEVWRFMVSA